MKLKKIISYLEEIAPLSYQENYDNSGLLVGNIENEIEKTIVCLDAVEDVVQEAIDKEAQLIIAHHPIIFSGLKSLTGKNYIERTIIKAIQNNIAIYAIHTNLDNVLDGVNQKISEKLGLINTKILAPKPSLLCKLISFVPLVHKNEILQALFEAGAGNIGNYSEASYSTKGLGTFMANENANPTIGDVGEREEVDEYKIEVLVPQFKIKKVLKALLEAHPYEEVAYDVIPLLNTNQQVGSGLIGELEHTINSEEFLNQIAQAFNVPTIKHTSLVKQQIKKVALCGGSGSFLLKEAISCNADILITADFKYHQFFDADNQIIIADIGHYESEQFTSELLIEKLNKKFSNFAVILTEVNTNPVKYFIKL